MAEIKCLGYLGFAVQDLAKWEQLAVDVLGMQLGAKEEGTVSLRLDDHEQRIVLESGDADDLQYAGWLFDTEDELASYVQDLARTGLKVADCGRELAVERKVEKAYFCIDPNGLRHEFAFGAKYASTPFTSKILNGHFVTGRLGIGHILVVAKNYSETVNFCRKNLGLLLSDYIRAPLETPHGVVDVDATFFHTVTGRHHSLATAQIPMPKRLHHLMIEVENINDVGLAHDRCLAAGFPVAMGLGHHPNDHMFSFYVQTPSGVLIEYGHGGVVIDDLNWDVKTYSQLSDWGHSHGH
ncbi:Glyoxalase/bleomycin resistance protein/dioxygenase [Methylocella silvestris BL2]|uniref:Glyoxalase/bleomycin resistance protein/dioxygenase n=1 Tax=Methylocella silvestris (strain DSM 15510 / CIP 108128 / LMG 27833 / NCIMB 13906 / BL2) TaxID=395965 RepID=B8ESU0_METSB|nr:VOC family protein [Methylocella silvestris]ACK50425.1 Glyoxalase/bleomycin resistance protein/dioxygenase [Methylocella silvestris BL2]